MSDVLELELEKGFESFRTLARECVARDIAPDRLRLFSKGSDREPDLFGTSRGELTGDIPASKITVPPAFVKLAEAVAHHASPGKWNLLYRILWRIQRENRGLLELLLDDDVREALLMEKAVRREIHKVHAFVRFERVVTNGDEHFFAWIDTEHPVLPLAAPFFARRFGDKSWAIFTPLGSAIWDGEKILEAAPLAHAPARTEMLDDLWKTYYRSSFNPARIKLNAMRAEMPMKYWKALPETEIISELLRTAPERLSKMAEHQNRNASPPETTDLSSLRAAARSCQACPLYENATQTVFGEGAFDAKLMIIGEQPGDQEDQAGRPFVGPAGEVFAKALATAGLVRETIYITNSVKHFKWKPGAPGKPRLHQKPSGSEMHACRPWLEKEIESVQPKVIVCMGATAATVLFGRQVKLGDEIGKVHEHLPWAGRVLVTYHPSAILRALSDSARETMRESLEATLALAARLSI